MTFVTTGLLEAARADGKVRAEAELTRLGFRRTDAGWLGRVSKDGRSAEVTVRLAKGFPDVLPEVFLQDPPKHPTFAHVERGGKLCLAPETGTLLDDARPEDLIGESIERAGRVLFISDQKHEIDLKAEFLSYWAEENAERVHSICTVPLSNGPISFVRVGGLKLVLAAPDRVHADTWASRVGKTLGETKAGYSLSLRELFRPPRFTERTTLGELLRLVGANADPVAVVAFRTWLVETGLPAYLLMSAPTTATEHVEFAVLLRGQPGKEAKDWQDGFRPGRAPRARQIAFANGAPISRLDVRRYDPSFLVERGGGSRLLLDKTVVVVGCGAVGSHLALLLAASGIGTIRLIDPERLGPENVHRHALGVDQVDQNKVDGLAAQIQRRFPHVAVSTKAESVTELLASQPDFVTDGVDAVVVAVGDETIERRLNRILPPGLRRVHVWLEPLGLGGHTLVTGLGRPGCYDCLYRLDDEIGLVNMSSFAEPGQLFLRTVGGCGGTFTPFGAMDAERAATEGANAITELLLGHTMVPTLNSWMVSKRSFLDSGHRLSPVGLSLEGGNSRRVEQFASPTCQTCAQW